MMLNLNQNASSAMTRKNLDALQTTSLERLARIAQENLRQRAKESVVKSRPAVVVLPRTE
jgi:hypothetical protein